MRMLVINDQVRRLCQIALDKAAKQPVDIQTLTAMAFKKRRDGSYMLKDRPAEYDASRRPASVQVRIEDGYEAAVSFEQQPIGLCKHLSIANDRPGTLPSPEAVSVIADLFGMGFPPLGGSIWVEEFEPGRQAINIVEPVLAGKPN